MDWLDIKEFFKDTFKYIVFVVGVLFVAIYVIGLQQVIGSSMAPNFQNNDVVLLDKISYKFTDIKRGDVVSLLYDDTKYLIKRVVGLPGDYIEFQDNKLYINNSYYDESYLDDEVYTENFKLEDLGYSRIPEDMYLVVGDNRSDSLDSLDQEVGLIPKKDIVGKVRLRIWPLNQIKVIN